MPTELVRARVSAIAELGHGVASYGKSLAAALASARADINRAQSEFQDGVADSGRGLRLAERQTEIARAQLAACLEGCEGIRRALAHCLAAQGSAKRRHERNLQAQARFERAAADLHSSMRSVEGSAETIVPTARRHIQEYAQTLTAYLKIGVSG